MGVKVLKVLLAATLGLAVLAQSAAASAQSDSNRFDVAEGPDDVCDLHLNVGGPYEVSIAGGPPVIYDNGSVVPVPQGSSVNYLRVERTIGFTAIGTNERCGVFDGETGSDDAGADVSDSAEVPATGSETSLVAIVGGVVVAVVLVAAGLTVVRSRRRRLD